MVLRRLNMVLSRKDIFHILDIWGGEPVIKINGINDRRHAKRRLVVDRKKEPTCCRAAGLENFWLDMKR